VTLYDTSTGRTLRVLPPVNLLGTAFSTDGRLFAENVAPLTGYSPDRLRVVDVATGHAVTGGGWPDSGELATPAISDDDRLVAVSAFTGLVSIGRTDDAKPFESFNQHAQVADIAFNPTGTRLAVASWDGSVTVLDVATDRPVLQLVGDTNGVTFVRYSPNGRYIVTSSEDSTVRVWDATSGQLLEIYTDDLYNSEIEVAGDSTLVGDVDSSGLRVWPLCADCQDPSALLASSRGSVVSPLTPLERTAAASGG
jgi:WD40 repeat protein